MFSVRIVDADFYVTNPISGLDVCYSGFRCCNVSRVPVIRIYGSTCSGQKTCVHIHQVFPYIFVPYDGTQPKEKYLKQFVTSVDFSLQVALGKATSSTHHVFHAEYVKRIPFYGFHENEKEFIKLQFYNPRIIAKVVDLLYNGAILNKVFQPFESHIPYILQFLIDYSLYGMNLLHASKVYFRGFSEGGNHSLTDSLNTSLCSPTNFLNASGSLSQKWNENTIPSELRLGKDMVKISRCELEVDIVAADIVNQLDIGTSVGTNPGISSMWEDERQRRRDLGQSSQITMQVSQERGEMALLGTEKDFKARIREIISERNQLIQAVLERTMEPNAHSNSPEDFLELSQGVLQDRTESLSQSVLGEDVDENTPVVDESKIEEVLQASQSQPNELSGQANEESADKLVCLAEDPNSPSPQECSLLANLSQTFVPNVNEAMSESENEDEESIIMSQPVWNENDLDESYLGVSQGGNDDGANGDDSKLNCTLPLDGFTDVDQVLLGNRSSVSDVYSTAIHADHRGAELQPSSSCSHIGKHENFCPSKCGPMEHVDITCEAVCDDLREIPDEDSCKSLLRNSDTRRLPQLDGCHDDDEDDQERKCKEKQKHTKSQILLEKDDGMKKLLSRNKTKCQHQEAQDDNDFKIKRPKKCKTEKTFSSQVRKCQSTTRRRKSATLLNICGGRSLESDSVIADRLASVSETTAKRKRAVPLNVFGGGTKSVSRTKLPHSDAGSERLTGMNNSGKVRSNLVSFGWQSSAQSSAESDAESQSSEFELRLSESCDDDFEDMTKIVRFPDEKQNIVKSHLKNSSASFKLRSLSVSKSARLGGKSGSDKGDLSKSYMTSQDGIPAKAGKAGSEKLPVERISQKCASDTKQLHASWTDSPGRKLSKSSEMFSAFPERPGQTSLRYLEQKDKSFARSRSNASCGKRKRSRHKRATSLQFAEVTQEDKTCSEISSEEHLEKPAETLEKGSDFMGRRVGSTVAKIKFLDACVPLDKISVENLLSKNEAKNVDYFETSNEDFKPSEENEYSCDSLYQMAMLSPKSPPGLRESPPTPSSPSLKKNVSKDINRNENRSNEDVTSDAAIRFVNESEIKNFLRASDFELRDNIMNQNNATGVVVESGSFFESGSETAESSSDVGGNKEIVSSSECYNEEEKENGRGKFTESNSEQVSSPEISAICGSFTRETSDDEVKSELNVEEMLKDVDIACPLPVEICGELSAKKGMIVEKIWKPERDPPSPSSVSRSRDVYGLPHERHRKAFCSDPKDVPLAPKVVGGRRLLVPSLSVDELPEFDLGGNFRTLRELRGLSQNDLDDSFVDDCLETLRANKKCTRELKLALMGEHDVIITPAKLPPSSRDVRRWLEENKTGKEYIGKLREPDVAPRTESKDTTSHSKENSLEMFSGNHAFDYPVSDKSIDFIDSPKLPGSGLQTCSPSKKFPTNSENREIDVLAPQHSTPVENSVNARDFWKCTPVESGSRSENVAEGLRKNVVSDEGFQKVDILRRNLLDSQRNKTSFRACQPISPGEASYIEGPTLTNSFGFKISQPNIQEAKTLHEVQFLTLLSLELHVRTRKTLRPDPEFDAICAIFYNIEHERRSGKESLTGVIVVHNESSKLNRSDVGATTGSEEINTGHSASTGTSRETLGSSVFLNNPLWTTGVCQEIDIISVNDETEAIHSFVNLVHMWDPDILIGFEVQMLSWGYLLQRATHLGIHLALQLSRVQDASATARFDSENDPWGANHTSEISISGRIVLNVWRLMRHEVTLNVYSFENIAYHVLHERLPLYTYQQLTRWWDQKLPHSRWKTVEHYVIRCQNSIRILNHVDFISRTSEFARLFGILFYSVISRGSQFRVESMMLRLVKPMNYLAVSPSIQQRARMAAPECIPLVMEPESRFYTDPVVVLDFQSLYPSMIIAYNYCFSTCLGKVSRLQTIGDFEFGCTSLNIAPSLLEKLEDDIHVSANGAAFVKSNIRKGILPRMLEEILDTRVMVKKAMKDYKSDKILSRVLDARQLGLKLIANVTYGYTSANFSGRMPCVEIADAIVRKARETLERAIHLVNTRKEWRARVVYGDTDSLFVLLKGATKEEAFKIGKEIVDCVTAENPKPVKLKFEKVYLPCVLQTKKRYVGYMYETLEQKDPVFDAKGIETVRRDTCPAVAKILEKSLRILFEEKDISLVKKFVQRQFCKLMEERVSLLDFIFAKEYRGMKYYKPTACVPALELTRRRLARDRRAEPRVGERVPYVVVNGSPGLPLIQLVRSPEDLLVDSSLRLNSSYYINKQILPPLDRVFSLIGIDVFTWFAELPRFVPRQYLTGGKPKSSISRYFTTLHCPVCEKLTQQGLCRGCRDNPQKAVTILADRVANWERKYSHLTEVCFQCCGTRNTDIPCVSLDCPVLPKRIEIKRKLDYGETLRDVQKNIEMTNSW